MSYLWRRVAAGVLQVAAVSVLAFLLFHLAPGDYYSAERYSAQARGSTIESWRKAQGLDQPLWNRYRMWAMSCLRGEFGTSIGYGMPVSRLVGPRIRRTLAVVIPAWLIGWAVGLTLAMIAVRSPKWLRLLEPATAALNTVPEVIVMSVVVWTAVWVAFPLDSVWLPRLGLIVGLGSLVFLHAVSALVSVRQTHFVRLAESRGVSERVLWFRFLLPAAAHPLIALLGPSLVGAVGASLVAEAMTGWPGLGPLFLEAVQARDYPVVESVVVMLAAALTVANLLGDLLLYRLDPRIRTGQ